MSTMRDDEDNLLAKFNTRYRNKKYTNLVVSFLIVILGVSSFIYGLRLEPSYTIFRYMTVDGTLFTTFGSLVYIFVNIVEVRHNTELTNITVYFIRLSSAVAEMVILLVTLLSHLPFFTESIYIIDRYDSFIMHAVLPVLTLVSFSINDSPIGKLRPMRRWHGTWFVTVYAVIILSLIVSGALERSLIPYSFLDITHNPVWLTVTAFVVIYGIAYLMSWFLSEINRKLSWIWFKGFNK